MTKPSADATSMSPTAHQVWTRARGLLLALLIIVVGGITAAALRSGDHHGHLDPRSADRLGSRAVATLLHNRGVSTRVVTTLDTATAAVGRNTTLVVAHPNMLTDAQREALHYAMETSGGRTILLSPGTESVATLAPGVRSTTPGPVAARDPQCSLAAARSAGNADLGGRQYITEAPGADACYPRDGRPTLLRFDTPNNGDTVLLGSADILYNHRLDDHGNASLALQLLGSRPHLVWYLPSSGDGSTTNGSGDPESTFLELIPSGWLWATLQLALAATLAAIWRGRRLGPLVTERLPVAIRASESTEGRARLYHQVNAHDRAAAALRSATRTRLAALLGVAPADAHSTAILIPAVATRTSPADRDLTALLFGPAPASDTALVLLADQLDALEKEVRTS